MTLGETVLPQTIVDRIVDHLRAGNEYASLAPYATVSKTWQIAVERHTFRQLYISSARLDDLDTIVYGRRQRTLQVITLHIALASYHRNQRSDAESREDGSATTRIFTSFMQDFFGTLSKWNVENGPPEGIHVEILIESPSDESSSSSRRVSPATTRRARASPVRIDLHRDALPAALVASALTCTGRHIELTSVLLLLEKMPNLRLLDTELEHDTNGSRDLEQRRGTTHRLRAFSSADRYRICARSRVLRAKGHGPPPSTTAERLRATKQAAPRCARPLLQCSSQIHSEVHRFDL